MIHTRYNKPFFSHLHCRIFYPPELVCLPNSCLKFESNTLHNVKGAESDKRERERERDRDRERERERERERKNSNSKTLILKDSSQALGPFGPNSQSLLYYKHK